VSPTGSKTGHPFLANGPRRSTRAEEPSRRSRVTHLTAALSSRGYQGNAAAEANLRAEWRSSVPSSFSLPTPLVVSAVSNTELECPSDIP
jgi:hypothetical protein